MNGIVILGCGACFRSGWPHASTAALLHLTLVTSLTRGWGPSTQRQEDRRRETKGSLPTSTRSKLSVDAGGASLKLISPIRPVKHAYTNTASISARPLGPLVALLVLTLLKVCHVFLIISTGAHARLAPVGPQM